MDFEVLDHYLMIKMPKEVDHHIAADINRKADGLLMKESVNHLVFDFEDTEFMDSSGIGIIVGRYRKINCLGGKVYVVHANPQIRRILAVSGLTKMVEIID